MKRILITLCMLFSSTISMAQSGVERIVNQVIKHTDSLIENSISDELFRSNILLSREDSKLIYVNFEADGEEVFEVEKTLVKPYNNQSPNNIKIVYDIIDEDATIGKINFIFTIKEYKISKYDYSTVKGLKDYLRIYSKVIKGKYIDHKEASSIAMKNGLKKIDEYKLLDDPRWRNNKESNRTKPTWILKEYCADQETGAKFILVVKVNAKKGKVTSLFKEYAID